MTVKPSILILSLLLSAAVPAWAAASDELPGDGAAWNAGVDAYRAGDVTNALKILRPLLTSETHAARAAEVVAKLEYDAAHALGETNSLKHLEAAAKAAQIALRAKPDDLRAQANFTRATDGLAELRETKRVNDVLAAAQGKDLDGVLRPAMHDVRQLMREADVFATNGSPSQVIERGESLSAKADKLADALIVFEDLASKSMTNETHLATLRQHLESDRALAKEAARNFGDLVAGCGTALQDVESDVTAFFKANAHPVSAISESYESQTNALAGSQGFGNRTWQRDALDFTEQFRRGFPQWAEDYAKRCEMETNLPPFTVEDRQKVEELSQQLVDLQQDCCTAPDETKQRQAANLALEIAKLIPDTNEKQSPKPNQQQNDQQQQDQQQQQNRDQQQDQDQKQDERQNEQQQPQPDEQKDEQKEQEAREAKEEEKSPEEKEDAALLQKIMERSAEHKADQQKRAGQRRVGKDW